MKRVNDLTFRRGAARLFEDDPPYPKILGDARLGDMGQRLCSKSSPQRVIWAVLGFHLRTGFQPGVQECKQLPNARDPLMTLKGLPIGFELGGKGFDDGIAALRGKRRACNQRCVCRFALLAACSTARQTDSTAAHRSQAASV